MISGIDGAGKTTQIQELLNYYTQSNKKAIRIWSRGGYTPVFEFLKNILRVVLRKQLPPAGKTQKREAMLKKTSIASLWLIVAILDFIVFYGLYFRYVMYLRRKIIIADRYIYDTIIDFRINFPEIRFERWLLWKLLLCIAPKPNVSFLLSIPLVEAEKRAVIKNEPYADPVNIRKLRYRYYQALSKNQSIKKINCLESIEMVTEVLIKEINKTL